MYWSCLSFFTYILYSRWQQINDVLLTCGEKIPNKILGLLKVRLTSLFNGWSRHILVFESNISMVSIFSNIILQI